MLLIPGRGARVDDDARRAARYVGQIGHAARDMVRDEPRLRITRKRAVPG